MNSISYACGPWSVGIVALIITACAAPAMHPDTQQSDATSDAVGDVAHDAPHDAGMACQADRDCTDGVFCNGAERCMPGAAGADARGCLPANPTSPCIMGQTCNESMMRCETGCAATPDADHDGHRAMECGGDDCDDSDPNRFPGNAEVCALNTSGSMPVRTNPTHDEDCDPTTFSNATSGDGDHDADGHVDIACCNAAAGGVNHCGDDCDDLETMTGFMGTPAATMVNPGDIHPAQPEVCNGVDDNCNGTVDEGATLPFYRDCDGDSFGDHADTGMQGCFARQFLQCSGHNAVQNNTDCDDAHAAAHPGGTEICDGVDDDCNGMTDENLSGTCTTGVGACAVTGQNTCAGSCVGSPGAPVDTLHFSHAANGSWDWNCNGTIDTNAPTTCASRTTSNCYGGDASPAGFSLPAACGTVIGDVTCVISGASCVESGPGAANISVGCK